MRQFHKPQSQNRNLIKAQKIAGKIRKRVGKEQEFQGNPLNLLFLYGKIFTLRLLAEKQSRVYWGFFQDCGKTIKHVHGLTAGASWTRR